MKLALRLAGTTAALTALALLACAAAEDGDAPGSHQAVALAHQEDEVCGMLVREQPAPRGQVVHRDGSRFFFCSLGDMLVHLGAPSSHGRAEASFVEVLEPGEDPLQVRTGPQPWVSADDAIYVVGIERPGIMGEPVLAYADRSEAERVAEQHPGARVLDQIGLREWWRSLEASR